MISNPYFQDALVTNIQGQKKQPFINLLDWTLRYRHYLAVNKEFDIVSHQYLKKLYDDASRDKEQVLCKSGQAGASELLISYCLWCADIRDLTVLFLFPTDTAVSDFSAARIGAAIRPEVSPYLSGIVTGAMSSGRSVDKVGLKRVRNRYVYLRGAAIRPDGRAPQLRAVDADVIVLDERDEMTDQAEALARERLGHSKIAEVRIASTPTYAGMGIWSLLQKTTKHTWMIKCDHCGNRQSLEINDLVVDWDDLGRPVVWNVDINDQPYLACRKCHGILNRLAEGEWVPQFPTRNVQGYHLSRLFMEHKPLTDILEGLISLDEYKRQQAYNQGLGLPYRPRSSNAVTPEILDMCTRDYILTGSPVNFKHVYMGVDVGNMLNVVIRQIEQENEIALWIGKVSNFEELDQLILRYNISTCVIDALPETRSARAFQDRHPWGKIWLNYYVEKKKTEPSETWDYREKSVESDRTRTLDVVFSSLLRASRGEPGKTLPAPARAIADYYENLCEMERVLKKSADGNMIPIYIGENDHYSHSENYCSIASRCPVSAGWSRGPGD